MLKIFRKEIYFSFGEQLKEYVKITTPYSSVQSFGEQQCFERIPLRNWIRSRYLYSSTETNS